VFNDNKQHLHQLSDQTRPGRGRLAQITSPTRIRRSSLGLCRRRRAGRCLVTATRLYDGTTITTKTIDDAADGKSTSRRIFRRPIRVSRFTTVQVRSHSIGGVCESGVTCTGNRDRLDDFGSSRQSPTTELAPIITLRSIPGTTAASRPGHRDDIPVCR